MPFGQEVERAQPMTYKSFSARNEQQAMKTMAVHSGMFRASENCPTSGRSNT